MQRRRKPLRSAVKMALLEMPKICPFCEDSGLSPNPKHNPFEIDHIIPFSKGGSDSLENLRWVCMYHNVARRTGNTTFLQGAGSKYFIRVEGTNA